MITSSILTVVERSQDVAMLLISSEPHDSGDAVGDVYALGKSLGVTMKVKHLLSTNDTLRVMWGSADHLWVASADGYVATTVPVTWPEATDVIYESRDESPRWSVTALPRLPDGLRPNITALWGVDHDNVFAAAYGGHIYRWDGTQWHLVHEVAADARISLLAFGGTGPNDVYAVGNARTLLHWDGRTFSPVAVPGPVVNETLTSVVALDDGSVLVSASGNAGRVLVGSAGAGFSELATTPLQLSGMARVADRIFLATREGAAELVEHEVVIRRSTFQASTVTGGKAYAYFTEPSQAAPAYIVHDPAVDAPRPWVRRKI